MERADFSSPRELFLIDGNVSLNHFETTPRIVSTVTTAKGLPFQSGFRYSPAYVDK